MKPERWARVEEIGARAAELQGSERDTFLADACTGDPELRRQIESLLVQVDAGDSFLETPLVSVDRTRQPLDESDRVGEFRIVGVLGEGGMGTVYEAERTGEGFVQRAALKLVQSRLTSRELVQRFMTERRILASLEHPGIARFIDGGTTSDGRPYVAMEFVDGRPITEYCRSHELGLDQRLAVFDQVCEAVQHAHENLVVHRDLKPTNILVTDGGHPKLLDFGIGKLLATDEDAEVTRTGHLVLTPRYAAPEQLMGGPITTATDVYALGILLYQLLTGAHPYAPPGLGLVELHEATLSHGVERPSERVARVGGDPSDPEPNETGARARWRRRMGGDLDSITLKALRKEPERRYPTVAALRDDLVRWRAGHPVSARPDSVAYRLDRFVTRNRIPVAVATLAFLLVSASAVFSTVQYVRAQREAAEARFERDRAEGVVSFMTGLFEWADPNRARGAEVTARELLAAGSARVDSAFQHDPELQAALYGTMAPIYTRIGLHEEAETLARSALAAGADLGNAGLLARHTLDLGRALHGQARFEEAEETFEAAVALAETSPEPLTHARALALLGGFYAERGTDWARAEEALEASLALYGEAEARRSLDATIPLQAQAMVYRRTERVEQAVALYREALVIVQDSLGRQHTRAAALLNGMGALEFSLGNYEATAAHLEEARDIRVAILGPTHEDVGSSWFNLAQVYYAMGRLDDGSQAYQRSLAIRVPALGEHHPAVANTRYNYGYYLSRSAEDYSAAVEQFEGALAAYRDIGGEEQPNIRGATAELAFALTSLERWEEAEVVLLERYRWTEREGGDMGGPAQAMVNLYEAWGRPERAAPYRTPPE